MVEIRNSDRSGAGAQCRSERLMIIALFALLWVVALGYRLFSLQIADVARWQEWAKKQHITEVQVASERGPIVDRNGKLLAVSVPAGSVYAHPKVIKDKSKAARLIAPLIGQSVKEVEAKLASDKSFVWLARQLPRFSSEKVSMLSIMGVSSVLEAKRFYPYNQAASAVVGKVGIDGTGLSGLELVYEGRLHEGQVTTRAGRDALGKLIHQVSQQPSDQLLSPPRGDQLELTLDADLQVIVDEELEAGMVKAKAKQAMAVMLDSHTGEILALSQAPAFNFNLSTEKSQRDLRSLLVETVYEPGSIMKPLVAAAAIEEKLYLPTDLINCENGRYPFGKHVIKDVHPSGTVSLHDVVVRSSNIGMTKVGDRLGANRLYGYLKRLGFGDSTNLGLPGESRGILRHVSKWSRVDVGTHAFGQGIAVTPLQIARATAAIANGGVLPDLKLVRDASEQEPRRIFSERTAAQVRAMMVDVVEAESGTGGNARIDGVTVGGKTGTAQKALPNGRGYQSGAYVASFVGFFDGGTTGLDRSVTLLVAIDEPRSGAIYGGVLAAPVFKRIAERSLDFLSTRQKLVRPYLKDPSELPRSASLQQVSWSQR